MHAFVSISKPSVMATQLAVSSQAQGQEGGGGQAASGSLMDVAAQHQQGNSNLQHMESLQLLQVGDPWMVLMVWCPFLKEKKTLLFRQGAKTKNAVIGDLSSHKNLDF